MLPLPYEKISKIGRQELRFKYAADKTIPESNPSGIFQTRAMGGARAPQRYIIAQGEFSLFLYFFRQSLNLPVRCEEQAFQEQQNLRKAPFLASAAAAF